MTTTPPDTPRFKQIHCPACRKPRRSRLLATVTIGGRAREIFQCTIAGCALTWVPTRTPRRATP